MVCISFHLNSAVIMCVSSDMLKCRLLKWLLAHPMSTARMRAPARAARRARARADALSVKR